MIRENSKDWKKRKIQRIIRDFAIILIFVSGMILCGILLGFIIWNCLKLVYVK